MLKLGEKYLKSDRYVNVQLYMFCPSGTWRNDNIIMTSKRRRDVVFGVIMTSLLRRVPVGAGCLQALHSSASTNYGYLIRFQSDERHLFKCRPRLLVSCWLWYQNIWDHRSVECHVSAHSIALKIISLRVVKFSPPRQPIQVYKTEVHLTRRGLKQMGIISNTSKLRTRFTL